MKKPPLHKSFCYTFKGLFWLLKNERNFQIHCLGLLVNLILIFYFKLQTWEIIAVLSVTFGVMIAEALNTCIEQICDFIEPNFDKRIGVIKDIAGAAVLIASILAVVVGILVYGKYLF
ncbi:diacylglycerol kinase family protein [Soonwooa sp.]|uniref:diacylglycerol kinase family protein n=1 Tax=Soonwooa sp. TaxID=1938592 RepID=UPI0028AA088E|nr:diacylglycerol kinase family protein [Soonwooa sp.]